MEEKYQKIKRITEKELIGVDSAHNIGHVMRVYNSCLYLAKEEKDIDLDVLKTAALLHDIARVKEDNDNTGRTCHARLSAKMATRILKKFSYSKEKIDKIVNCILAHRYRTGVKPETKEAKILFDADKLDCIGATGVARSFVWVGRNYAKIYTNVDTDEYIKDNLGGKTNGRIQDKTKHSPYIEFETKLKFLPSKLYTSKAKKIAKERTKFFKNFLKRLEKEVKGKL